MYFKGQFSNKFDAIASFSSLEHIGLGRYSDELDPDGDFKEVARA